MEKWKEEREAPEARGEGRKEERNNGREKGRGGELMSSDPEPLSV